MKLPTVKLINREGRKIKINEWDYIRDLKYWNKKGYKLYATQTNVDTPDDVIRDFISQQEKEEARRRNPEHPAYKDKQRNYEARQEQAGRPSIRTSPMVVDNPNWAEPTKSEPAAEAKPKPAAKRTRKATEKE